MKQIFRLGDHIEVRDVPEPKVTAGFVLVKNHYSLISTGTETRALKGSFGIIKKVLRTPKKILRNVEDKSPLGYSCAGVVLEIGDGVKHVDVGDIVLCCGLEYAVHAEKVAVPQHLVMRIPRDINPSQAVFAPLGSVSLHALRRGRVTLGETAVVVGLGLTGQLLVQLLRLVGCRVIGIDPHDYKAKLAEKHGADFCFCGKQGFAEKVMEFTHGMGADATFLCADMRDTESLEEITRVLRDRGKIIAIGNITCPLPWTNFFRKELDLMVSRSFGPGRFDSTYEEKGIDYPIGYVRWTERRNILEILNLLSMKKIVVDDLVSGEYPLDHAEKAYQSLLGKKRPIALLLTYSI